MSSIPSHLVKTKGYFEVSLVNRTIAFLDTWSETLDLRVIAAVMKVPSGTFTVPPPVELQSSIASLNALVLTSTAADGKSTVLKALLTAPYEVMSQTLVVGIAGGLMRLNITGTRSQGFIWHNMSAMI